MDSLSLAEEIKAVLAEVDQLQKQNIIYESYLEENEAAIANIDEGSLPAFGDGDLTLGQKLAINKADLEKSAKRKEEESTWAEDTIDSLQGMLKETERQIKTLMTTAYEFKKDVVVGAENARTGDPIAEKVLKYFEDRIQQTDSVIASFRSKNKTLRGQVQKLETELKQERPGQPMHHVDFYQLQIENKQSTATLKETSDELIYLKKASAQATQSLAKLRAHLQETEDATAERKNDIAKKEAKLQNIEKELTQLLSDVKKEKKSLNKFEEKEEGSVPMPKTLDYVKQKAEMYELLQALNNWERKVEIAELAAKNSQRMNNHEVG